MRVSARVGPRVGERAPGGLPGTATTLGLDLAADVDPVAVGDNVTITATVSTGAADATHVVLEVVLGDSLAFVSATGAAWTITHHGRVVVATAPLLADGVTVPLDVVATVTTPSPGPTYSRARVSADNAPTCSAGIASAISYAVAPAAGALAITGSAVNLTHA